ncbi:hypothetical protein LTR97_004443 [Elasticomyces elasticus]|uniref:Uncharacterized protein n=1 Tax=Elasticomyces elasticus TaxID=574655 RepID=A0AAN7WAK5_9PEZI|nr:hypothetical protein LTR97_004443 [Elasticomyces elasticus]
MASERVFGIMELRESILDLLDERTLLLSQGINKTFASAITDSAKYQRKLFFTLDESTAQIGIDDIKVNPLLAERVPADRMRSNPQNQVFLTLKSNFLEVPDHHQKAYRLKSETGSWQKMYLLSAPTTAQVTITFGTIRSHYVNAYLAEYESKTVDIQNWPLRYIAESAVFQRQLRIAGLLCYVDGLGSRIRVLNLEASALQNSQQWVNALRGVTSREYALLEWAVEHASDVVDPAKKFDFLRRHGFLAAVEELEGREGQHHETSDELVRVIRARPNLLAIKDDETRHMKWRIACFGSA